MKPPKRGEKGTMGGRIPLSLPDDIRLHAAADAKRQGVSLSEWIREAIRRRLSSK
jgi:predicted HicB family RNase H-like nuclease